MRELNFQDVMAVFGAVKDNFELYLYAKVPGEAGAFFGGLITNVLNGTLSLEDFAKAIVESPGILESSKITSLQVNARYSSW